jgi:hypothetical protein
MVAALTFCPRNQQLKDEKRIAYFFPRNQQLNDDEAECKRAASEER